MPKILYDLAFGQAQMGFSGIPQDTRLLFNGLNSSKSLSVSGMLRSFGDSLLHKYDLSSLLGQSQFIGCYLNNKINQQSFLQGIPKIRYFEKHYRKMKLAKYILTKESQRLYPVINDVFDDMIWRNYFHSTVPPSEKEKLLCVQYYLSTLGNDSSLLTAANKRLSNPKINTHGFDFFLTQDSRSFEVSSGTIKIIRYHDGIPVFMSDTMPDIYPTKNHIEQIKACEKDSIYVCNSTSALKDLEIISPLAAKRAKVIPYFLPKLHNVTSSAKELLQIARARVAPETVKLGTEEKCISNWFNHTEGTLKVPKFIMTLSTLEPRKNHLGLIQAWQKLRLETGEDIKFLIVGSPGWNYDKIISAIKPFVQTSDILHLSKVAQAELPYLYSAADCFVFPSYGEGFGLPPSEAMQCDCPVAISDIPAHRYSAGDAALFFNPYDIEDMTAKIKTALTDPNVRTDLIKKGHQNHQRFSENAVLPQWETLFKELSTQKKASGAHNE